MVHEDYKEMLPVHALSSLDADDARALDQHLSECAECRRELADWEHTAAALALTATPAEPSRQVRQRIMTTVRSETRPQQASKVVPFPSTQIRRQMWASFGRIGVVAAAVLLLAVIIWIVILWQQNRELRRTNDALASDINWMGREVARLNEFVEILSTPGAKVTPLYGSSEASGATAQLVYDRTGRAMLMARNLPPAPAGKQYQLWFIVGENPIAGRLFVPDEAGRGEVTDQIPQQAIDAAVFAVTLEPEGGNISPTGDIYLRSGQ